ncbi:MAG: hypothetical protein HYV90_02760 [Candidatus Woesebacteria bacterium]|nr:MAG: hypothetical protein HYV90_02760 [Candidatus Woesebacteria bacterium]
MNSFKRIFLVVIGLVAMTAWAGKGLFKYSIYQTHDLDHHLVRTLDAVATLKEGAFPLRWAGILNFECGTPIYNFFNPLFYYISASLTFVTGNIMNSIKIISLLSLFMGSLFFFLWLKNETKDWLVSFVGSLLYLYAPYKFSLIYVRGSPEYLAYAILPAVFYFYSLAIGSKKNRYVLYLFLASVSGGLLSIAHNVVFLLGLSVITVYLVTKVLLKQVKEKKEIILLIFSYLSIIGFGAFFIFPALLEEKFTQIGIPVFFYKDHFPILSQLLYSPWGYGDSAIGTKLDGMSFQIGLAQWIVLVVALVYLACRIYLSKFRLNRKFILDNIWIIVFSTLSLLFIFIDLPSSGFIWEKITILQAIQFPWRVLGIIIFVLSAVFAFVVSRIKYRPLYYLIILVIPFLALIANRNYLLPQPVYQKTLIYYENLSTLNYSHNSVTQFQDNVLPLGKLAQCSSKTPVALTDTGKIVQNKEIKRGSTYGSLMLTIGKKDILGQKIILNLDYFPGVFAFTLNGKTQVYSDCEGRVCLAVNDFIEGDNVISWNVVQSKIERLFNAVTLTFIVLWLIIIVYFCIPNFHTLVLKDHR